MLKQTSRIIILNDNLSLKVIRLGDFKEANDIWGILGRILKWVFNLTI